MSLPLTRYIRLLRRYLRPQWPRVTALSLLLGLDTLIQVISPQMLRRFIDDAVLGSAANTLMYTALLFIGLTMLSHIGKVATTWLSEDVGWTATNGLRNDLAAHCLRLDMAFHKRRTPGELIERVDGDVNALSNFFSQFTLGLLGNLLLMCGVLVVLFLEDWRIGIALGLFVIVAVLVLVQLRNIAVGPLAAEREESATFFGFLSEHLSGTEDIRANGANTYVMRSFYRRLQRWLPITRKASLTMYAMWMSSLVLFSIGHTIAFGISALLWHAQLISIGTVYMIFHYAELLRQPIDQIRRQVEDLQRASASIGRVEELLAIQPSIRDGEGGTLPLGPLSVELRNVSFAYEDEIVLSDISFQLKRGRTLGLLGHTGSGKTSLARLLLRLYDASSGTILLGDHDLRSIPLSNLRQRVGMVTQEGQLFHATVRDNLTFFNHTISDEQVLTVIDELGLGAWLRRLPNGLNSEFEGDSGLSAGEAQLLAFARLFLIAPGLVILDEASSRLDPATEQLIEQAINRLLQGRTAIIIAHRLATVQRADEIMILEQGRIVEHGERVVLLSDPNSRFVRLMQTGMAEVLT